MEADPLQALLGGSDDEFDLWNLYLRLDRPKNAEQRAFRLAWEAETLLGISGFEKLFEQYPPLEEYSAALVEVGVPQAKPIFDEVTALVPVGLRRERGVRLFEHLHSHYDELQRLLYEFYDATAGSTSNIAGYIRQHRSKFEE